MVHAPLTGSFVALVTPFNRDGSIDFAALEALVTFQTTHGTPALFFLGTAGEKAALSDREWCSFVEKVSVVNRNGARFFFGSTGHCTQDTCDRLRFAESCGADGAVLTVPPYTGPTADEAAAMFLTAADATDLPLGIYNNPSRLMTDLTPGAMAPVFAHPNVIVYKEGTGNTGQVAALMAMSPPVTVMAADSIAPDVVTPVMALGGQGICNAFGNIAPTEAMALSRPWQSPQDAAAFRSLFLKLRALMAFAYCTRSPVAIKGLMQAIGLPAGYPRLPLTPLDAALIAQGKETLEAIGYFQSYGYTQPT